MDRYLKRIKIESENYGIEALFDGHYKFYNVMLYSHRGHLIESVQPEANNEYFIWNEVRRVCNAEIINQDVTDIIPYEHYNEVLNLVLECETLGIFDHVKIE